jgi:hypothetical protein
MLEVAEQVELAELQREYAAVEANQEIVRIIDTPLSAMLADGSYWFDEDEDDMTFTNGHITVHMEKTDFEGGATDVSAMLGDGSFSFHEDGKDVTFSSGDTLVDLVIMDVAWKTKAPERPVGPTVMEPARFKRMMALSSVNAANAKPKWVN